MRRLEAAVLVGTGALVLWFYLWTASAGLSFEWGGKLDGYYNLLTQSLLQGRLDLPVDPRPELLELIDPYDPAKNAPYRLHDVSLYRGRYYLYFGVAPALTLFLPARLLGLGDLPEGFAAALLSFGGFVWALLLLRHLTGRFLPATPPWMQWLGGLSLGLVNVAPFILRGPAVYDVYHVAISAGYFFVFGAAYWLATAGLGDRVHPGRLALGSLFLGLAVAGRPNHLFAAPLLLLVLPALRREPARWGRTLAAALVPLALCLLLVGLYNRARFGSWTEFGVRYQLAGSHVQKLDTFDTRSILPGLYFYFLSPPHLGLDFPFVSLAPRYPGPLPLGYYGPEPIAGVFAHTPFLAVLLVAPALLQRVPPGRLRLAVATLAGTGLLSALVASFVFPSATMRYEVDFGSFLLVPALLLWFLADALAEDRPRLRRGTRVVFVLTVAYAIAINTALSLTGYEDARRRGNPPGFAGLERAFEPLRRVAGRLFAYDARTVVRLHVAFPERFAAEREPLLSSGMGDAADVVFVEQPAPDRVVFGLQHEADPPVRSTPVTIRPGAFHAVEVGLDRVARRAVVRLEGREAAVLEGPLGLVRRDWIWPARGPKGGDGSWGRFSGAMVTTFQIDASPAGLEALPDIAPVPAIHTGSRETPPVRPEVGQLWITSRNDGALLFDGATWRWISRPAVDRVRFDRRIALHGRPAGAEPLVVSGHGSAVDLVGLFPAGGGRAAIGFDRWRGSWERGPRSAPIALEPGRAHALTVVLDRPGRLVLVDLDGREVLRATADLTPLLRAELRVGAAPPGLVGLAPSLSGRISQAEAEP